MALPGKTVRGMRSGFAAAFAMILVFSAASGNGRPCQNDEAAPAIPAVRQEAGHAGPPAVVDDGEADDEELAEPPLADQPPITPAFPADTVEPPLFHSANIPADQGAMIDRDPHVPQFVTTQEPPRYLPLPEKLAAPSAATAPGPLSEWLNAPGLYRTPVDPPLGFSGPSGIVPRELQTDHHFVPVEDRWRVGFPAWDRYGTGHPPVDDYPYVEGSRWDPFNLNVLKGDYPIIGQHTFLAVTAASDSLFEYHEVPIPTTPFESTERPRSYPFFGRPNQFLFEQFLTLSVDLFHGDAAFKPPDWRIKLTPVFNVNYLAGQELGIISPDVRDGVDRGRTFTSLQEWFVETKLADLGPNYDFVSARIGSQPFTSDFRGFIFSDTNRAVRIFGTNDSNRGQFNVAFFAQQEKDTNSMLNTFDDRHQRIVMANYYFQDFVYPGYTAQLSVHYNHDDPSFKFDKNDFLVRPDPVGVFTPHGLDIAYLGWAGDGHIDRVNINHAFYWALGRDSLNPLANRPQDVSAQMAALELSYDRDWIRFRTSLLWGSGDRNPRNSHATGFDGIFDNPNFAGGEFSYWQRQSIRLLGVNLTNRGSLFADLRSSKIQGQSNFVNPGIFLVNFATDFDVTPKLRMVANANLLWFDNTESLKLFVFQDRIRRSIGTDLALGMEYRPFLSNNVIARFGVQALLPGAGFRDLYGEILNNGVNSLLAAFLEVHMVY